MLSDKWERKERKEEWKVLSILEKVRRLPAVSKV